jgi:HK97 family phage major capsid protein
MAWRFKEPNEMNSPIYQELSTKREELAAMFKAAEVEKDGQVSHNFTADQLGEVNKRNTELNELNDKWEAEHKLLAIKEANDRAIKDVRKPVNQVRHAEPDASRTVEEEQKSIARQFVESPQFKAARESRSFKGVDVEMKGVELKTLMTTSAGFAPFVPRIDRVELYPDRRPLVGSLLPQIPTNDSAIKYMEETTRTNNSAAVSEGSAMGENALVYTERTQPIEDIGGWIPVTMQQLEDVAGFEAFIGSRLGYMVGLAEENELVNGNNSSPSLNGFLNASGVQSQAATGIPVPDAVLKAMTKVRGTTAGSGFAEPSGVILHPTDWMNIRLLRTTTGLYIWGAPSEAGPERLWGKPVVQTPVIAQGTALTGDFEMYAAQYNKQEVRIQITDSHDVYFVANKFAIKAYKRTGLVVFRPTAFCKVTSIPLNP